MVTAPTLVPIAGAFVLVALLTPVVRFLARRYGAIAAPKADRWHSKPTAMMGGAGIFVAVLLMLAIFGPKTREAYVVLVASAGLFVLGLVDDILHIKPYQKLIGQILGAVAVIYFGLVLPWTPSFAINMTITLVWLVGITNAVNMLDNMDGLSAAVSAIAAFFLGLNFFVNRQPEPALMLFTFAAALLGFLLYNHNPASIFMGDCGSMFIGFFLASSALLSKNAGGGRSRSVIAVLSVPVLVLCIPIFDTTFVTVMRKLAGRSAAQGGRDHTSHRLVALGLSERHAVWMLYGFAGLAGLLALIVRRVQLDISLAAIAGFTIVVALVGVYLARVRVYSDEQIEMAQQKPLVALLFDLSHKRRIFEVALDVVLIVLAYYVGYALVFGPMSGSSDWQLFIKTLPIVVFVKLTTFLLTGMYRGIWRYASVQEVGGYFRSVALGSAATILAILFAFRFNGFSRTVFALDGILLLMMIASSRLAFRGMRGLMPAPHARTARRVLIYGAGDGGELMWRELRNNVALQYVPVAFVDDDPRKSGKLLHGMRIYKSSRVAPLCISKAID